MKPANLGARLTPTMQRRTNVPKFVFTSRLRVFTLGLENVLLWEERSWQAFKSGCNQFWGHYFTKAKTDSAKHHGCTCRSVAQLLWGLLCYSFVKDGKATGIRALKYELAKFVVHMQSHLMLSEDAVFQIQIPVL